MRTLQKTLLIAALVAIPFAGSQAQTQGTNKVGEMPESSKPDPTPPPTKSPHTGTPATSGTATGEAPHSTVPGTDKPATTNTANPKLHGSDVPSNNAPPSSGTGTPQQTAPSGESPPRAAPMRSGADANSNQGTSTISGSDKK
jgi:hypothetical protein